ncbi:MAG: response regulator [Candidatus Symbiothrix sp.]|nr:response regulator [Candidatus Symbiothrix sp.]
MAYRLLLCALILVAQAVRAQFVSRYNIAYITMENGLQHNFIDNIYRDSRGFVWIATGGSGLSRYDGYEFIHFNIYSRDIKLKSNFIRQVCEDNFRRLWIVSEGGIDIIDLNRMQTAVLTGLKTLPDEPAINITKDSRGNIWLLGGNSLNKISFAADGAIANIAVLPNVILPVASIAMSDLDEDGNIWAGIENKVCKLYEDGAGSLRATVVSPQLEFPAPTTIMAFRKKDNEIWIGTNNGLLRYDRNTGTAKRYIRDRNNPKSLSQNYITDIVVTEDRDLLIGTLNGINIYQPDTDSFEHLGASDNAVYPALNSDFVNCLFIDGKSVWAGTETGGINKLTPWKLSVKSYKHRADDAGSLSRNIVNAIYEDRDGRLWVGTVEGGLNCKAKDSDIFTHYTTETPAALSHNSVSAIAADAHNRLWAGTWGNGLNIIDKNTMRVIKTISTATMQGMPVNFIGALHYDPLNNLMWAGTNSGIYYYDYKSEKMKAPFPAAVNDNIHGLVGAIIDRHNRLWMGCMEGLYIIDLTKRSGDNFEYKHLKYKLNDPSSRLTDHISSLCITADGTVYVGSNGCGLYRHLPAADGSLGRFEAYTSADGLINNNVIGILEDAQGFIWISTNNGLSRFSPTTKQFINFTRDDGLPGNQFYWNAYCRSQNGTLYFGGLDGLLAIDPVKISAVKCVKGVTFTKFSIMNREVQTDDKYLFSDISVAKNISLHERDKSFSLEFSALNYDNSATSAYFYRLLGFDERWIETPSTRRFASYTNLPAGKYVFQVKYSPNGVFDKTSPVSELNITVQPFFWKTVWFILLVILLAGCLAYWFYKRRIRVLKNQQKLLYRKVEERTRKLEQQKKQLIEMAQKVEELTTDKIAFFTGITHEFRTPITLIVGPIERALRLSVNPQVIEQLRLVERNSKYLLSLVNQLMDFRKIEAGKMDIIATMGNFEEFLNVITAPFEAFAADRGITIIKYTRFAEPHFLFDGDAMRKILTNIISNAIKFTPDKGTVRIYAAAVKDAEGGERLFLSVIDTGTGIPQDDLEKIFDRFYQSAGKVKYPVYGQSGTGIGLYVCKEIVLQLGGKICAANNKTGTGSNFRILLPLKRGDEYESVYHRQENSQILHPATSPEYFVAGRKTILIVEDNADMREYIRSILADRYNTLEAGNGEEALAVLSECNIDFIISDLMMPVMDGLELSRRVKENFSISHIPFLMLTAKTAPETRAESYRMGVDAYMMKPFSEDALLSRIANIFESQKRYQQYFSMNMNVEALQIEEESSDSKFLNRVLEVLRDNYNNPDFRQEDFTRAMGVSKSLLNKKLQSVTGQSTGQFIRNYRLNIARELIEKNSRTHNLNISEIAWDCGFNDPKYFTRCFHRRFNMPPSSLMK